MAILVIWASPNENGLTAAAKDQVAAGIHAGGGEIQLLHLNRQQIQRCLACGDGWGSCRSDGHCVLDDDFAAVYQKWQEADGVVLITPVYWHDLAENLKCLLDRLRRCESAHNHTLEGKACLLVACAGGSGRGAISCLDRMEQTLAHMGMIAVDRLPVTQFNRRYLLPALAGAGQAFSAYVQNGK